MMLFSGITFFLGLIQWISIGGNWSWVWLIALAVSLGFSLQWIHIYLRPIHNLLKILWLAGCIGIVICIAHFGAINLLLNLSSDRFLALAIGPLFAALSGLGFKEFFCFRRPEAIGITILIPIAFIGHIGGFINHIIFMILMISASISLIILAMRKFGIDASADIGDKSIFEFLEKERTNVRVI